LRYFDTMIVAWELPQVTIKQQRHFDFAADAQAAIDFLARQEGIDENNIGIIGHSEGAIIASILAAREEISWDGWASANGAGHEDTCDTCGAAGFNETRESSRPAFIVLLAWSRSSRL